MKNPEYFPAILFKIETQKRKKSHCDMLPVTRSFLGCVPIFGVHAGHWGPWRWLLVSGASL